MVRGLFHLVHLLDLTLSIRLKAVFSEALLDLDSSVGLLHRGISGGQSHLVLLDLALSRL